MSRIGVFVCHCGLNIAKTVKVSAPKALKIQKGFIQLKRIF